MNKILFVATLILCLVIAKADRNLSLVCMDQNNDGISLCHRLIATR